MQISKDLAAIGRYLRRQRTGYMAPLGLKGLHARLLVQIVETPGLSQDNLAQRVGFDKSNIARQVALLEEMGYLNRKASGTDKRVLELYPTEKTLAMQPSLQAAMEQWEKKLLRTLTEEEKTVLTGLLEKLRKAAEDEE